MSTQNTKIAVSKVAWGVKLPHESSKVGNGYTANGPVVTYKLPPEEIDRIFSRAKKPEGKPPIHWKNPHQHKEVKQLPAIQLTNKEAEKILTPEVMQNCVPLENNALTPAPDQGGVQDQEPTGKQPEKTKTRMEIARGKLSHEAYKKLSKTMSDKQIRKTFDIAIDVLIALKREWGIEIKPIISRTPEAEKTCEPVQPEPEPKVEHHQELNLIDAMKLKCQLAADVDCADYLVDPETIAVDVTAGIKLVLETYRCECATKLKRLEDVLSRISVTI